MRTLLFLIFVFAFISCQPPATEQDQPGVKTATQDIAYEASNPRPVLVSWHLTSQFGGIQRTGASWVTTHAFRASTNENPNPPTLLLDDLILELGAGGVLDKINLQSPGSQLIITGVNGPSWAVIQPGWILDSKEMAQEPTPKPEESEAASTE